MSVLFDENDLHRWLDERTIRKAAGYLDRVYDLRMEGDLLRAHVAGTATQPYRVTINLKASLRSPHSRLHGRCSCPGATTASMWPRS